MTEGLALFDTAIGACAVAWRGGRVVGVALPEGSQEATRARLARRTGLADAAATPPEPVAALIADGQAMLEGRPREGRDWPLDLSAAPELHRRIYALLRETAPYGRTTTYGELARGLGDVRLAQSVGRAMATNPAPLFVPCHRVLGEGGRVGGFSGGRGAATKLAMLNIERSAGGGDGLFPDLPLSARPR